MAALTVQELTEVPYLRTRIFAGGAGAGRTIAWAHSIELPRPWEWIEAGDMLMTVGLGLPTDPAAQATYVENLVIAGASALTIGEGMSAPPLSERMIEAAESAALPLLFTAYEVPFVQISRLVAAANRDAEHAHLVKAVRIYDRARIALIDAARPAQLLSSLGEEIRCRLAVYSSVNARPLLPDSERLPDAVCTAFAHAARSHAGALPGILRLIVDGATVLVVPVPARQAASLIAIPTSAATPPYAILQHVATVAALELERQWAAREELRRLGSETLAQLRDARISGTTAESLMAVHGFGGGPFLMLAVTREGGLQRSGWLHHALAERAIPNMLLREAEMLYCFLPSSEPVLEQVLELLGSDACIGCSDAFGGPDGTAAAMREARWALAQQDDRRVRRYGERLGLFGPRSIPEARELVETVLGRVLAYDREHRTELVASLACFLHCNRSWLKASAELFIHKQTLVYRIRRVEELTARKLDDTAGVAELWMAIEAHELLVGERLGPAGRTCENSQARGRDPSTGSSGKQVRQV